LVKLIAANKFREDLFYRLNVVTIELPPLRECLEDIPALVRHFIKKSRQMSGKNLQDISPHAMKCLMNYNWPGNIRELENVIERASVLSGDATIEVEDLTPNIVNATANFLKPFDESNIENGHYTKRMEEFEKQLIFNALLEMHGNISRAAQHLGLKRTTLRYKMEKHDLLRFKFE
jgi:DNA-binding NtrC family response regulator